MRAYPTGTAEPAATVLTYSSGPGSHRRSHPLHQTQRRPRPDAFTNHAGKTDLVIDVTGYYIPTHRGH